MKACEELPKCEHVWLEAARIMASIALYFYFNFDMDSHTMSSS